MFNLVFLSVEKDEHGVQSLFDMTLQKKLAGASRWQDSMAPKGLARIVFRS